MHGRGTGGGDGWSVAWQAGISGALILSFISMVLLGPVLGFSPSPCLRHVGGGFLTHGSRSQQTMKVLSVRAPSPGRYECDVTAHEHTHSSPTKSQTRIHQQQHHTELALINTCFHKHVPPDQGKLFGLGRISVWAVVMPGLCVLLTSVGYWAVWSRQTKLKSQT